MAQNYSFGSWSQNQSFSSWEELIKGVPQRSALGSILFNLCLNDLLCLADFTEAWNFAYGTTFHACDNDRNNFIKRLEHDAFLAIELFETYNTKLNKEKCHLLVSGYKYGLSFGLKWGMKKFEKVPNKKLLRIGIGRNLNFDDHVISCEKN